MLSQVAHEFRTPINCMLSFIESAMDIVDSSVKTKYFIDNQVFITFLYFCLIIVVFSLGYIRCKPAQSRKVLT